jgi:hypothetical protein
MNKEQGMSNVEVYVLQNSSFVVPCSIFVLPCKDSNPDIQSQNLTYYHYTTGQGRITNKEQRTPNVEVCYLNIHYSLFLAACRQAGSIFS